MENFLEKNKIGGVLVEGSDQVGKTTFCNRLSELTGMPTIHYRYEKNVDQVEYYTRPLRDPKGPFLIDRNYMSELVYGGELRGVSLISGSMKHAIETMYDDAKYFLVLLHRKDLTIDKLEDRPEEFTKSEIMRVREAFLSVYDEINLDKMMIDAFDPDALAVVLGHWKQKNGII